LGVGEVVGANESFEEAFDTLFPRAERLAFRILGDWAAAEDAAAEALARTFTQWKKVCGLPHRDGWVLRVATNVAIDNYRRRRPEPAATEPVDVADAAVMRVALADALTALPRRQQAVIALRHFEGMTEQEIALALGLSLGTVKTHARRGTEALRRRLGEFQEVPLGTD
jgi:RNA polymerase sigma factor (sigma-70 family)